MINELLWMAGAKQQHDIQKSAGLAGIFGIATVLLIAIKWQDWFYPLFKKIGIVDFAHRIGLVRGDFHAMTTINIILFFVTCLVIVMMACVVVVFGGLLLLYVAQTSIGRIILSPLLLLILPFMIPSLLRARKEEKQALADEKEAGYVRPQPFYKALKKDKALEALENKHNSEFENVKMFRMFEEQTLVNGEIFDLWQTQEDWKKDGLEKSSKHLNRAVASIENDLDWIIGYKSDERQASANKFYIFLPNPLPHFASQYFLDDLYTDGSEVRSSYFENFNLKRYLYSDFDAPRREFLYNYLYKASTHVSSVTQPSFELLKEEYKEIGLLYVPALEIEFAWDGYAVSPRIVEGAEMQSMNMDKLNLYHVQSAKMKEFFTEVSKEEMVQQAIKEAHIAMYLIPKAYPNDFDESGISYTGHFKRMVANTPNAEAFAPLYAADVQERIIAYAHNNKEWAVNWLAKDV